MSSNVSSSLASSNSPASFYTVVLFRRTVSKYYVTVQMRSSSCASILYLLIFSQKSSQNWKVEQLTFKFLHYRVETMIYKSSNPTLSSSRNPKERRSYFTIPVQINILSRPYVPFTAAKSCPLVFLKYCINNFSDSTSCSLYLCISTLKSTVVRV